MSIVIGAAGLLLAGMAVSGCSGAGHGPAVKVNGCTAVTHGTSGGRLVVTYRDATGDPAMSRSVDAAVAAWNAAKTNVVLQPAQTAPSITVVAADAATTTTRCTGHGPRTVRITIDSNAWHGTGGKKKVAQPERLVAIEFGHALGLERGGGCTALMHRGTCSRYATGPDRAEIAEIDRLYPVPTTTPHT